VTPCQPLPTPEHPKPRRHDPAVEPHEDKGTGVAEPVPSLATVDHSNGDRQQETGDARTGESAPQLPTGELVAAHNRESTNVLVSQTHPTRSGHDSVLLNNAAEDLGCGPAGSATPPPRPNRGPMTIRGQSSPGLGSQSSNHRERREARTRASPTDCSPVLWRSAPAAFRPSDCGVPHDDARRRAFDDDYLVAVASADLGR
jgi:hypothetical protein